MTKEIASYVTPSKIVLSGGLTMNVLLENKPPPKRITLRVPRSLHAALKKEAHSEGISLNQLCLTKLSIPLKKKGSRGYLFYQ